MLPYDPRRRCALTASLFRAPLFAVTGRETLEEPCAGMIDEGEDAATLDAARIDNALLLHLVMALRLRHPELFPSSAA